MNHLPGKLKKPKGSLFFLIVSFDNLDLYYELKQIVEKKFSTVQFESPDLPKCGLNYSPLLNQKPGNKTKIITFQRRINREELPSIQKIILPLQKKIHKFDPVIQIYPGYLNEHNVILGSIFDDFYKIYLFNGVFAEIIYVYIKHKFQPLEYTHPFFREKEVMYHFQNLREYYLNKSK